MEMTSTGTATKAHLALLAVDPTYQSHGLGRSLLASITDTLVREGFTEVTLGVLEKTLAARKIYEGAGWQATGRGFFEDWGRPCIHYELGLDRRQPMGKTSRDPLAVATNLPPASVTVPSAKATRLPAFDTTPTQVNGPLPARTGRR
jgi:hypothetical protein